MQDKSLQDVWYNRQNASPFLTDEGSGVLLSMQFRGAALDAVPTCYGKARRYALQCWPCLVAVADRSAIAVWEARGCEGARGDGVAPAPASPHFVYCGLDYLWWQGRASLKGRKRKGRPMAASALGGC
jgi:hypothetical protein